MSLCLDQQLCSGRPAHLPFIAPSSLPTSLQRRPLMPCSQELLSHEWLHRANKESWEEKIVHHLQRQDTEKCQDALCGGPLGSQQTLLMGCVLDCHLLPLKLGTPAAPGHPAMPRVLSCWGSLGCFANGATSQLRGKPLAEQSTSSSWEPHWLLRGLHAGDTSQTPSQSCRLCR